MTVLPMNSACFPRPEASSFASSRDGTISVGRPRCLLGKLVAFNFCEYRDANGAPCQKRNGRAYSSAEMSTKLFLLR